MKIRKSILEKIVKYQHKGIPIRGFDGQFHPRLFMLGKNSQGVIVRALLLKGHGGCSSMQWVEPEVLDSVYRRLNLAGFEFCGYGWAAKNRQIFAKYPHWFLCHAPIPKGGFVIFSDPDETKAFVVIRATRAFGDLEYADSRTFMQAEPLEQDDV